PHLHAPLGAEGSESAGDRDLVRLRRAARLADGLRRGNPLHPRHSGRSAVRHRSASAAGGGGARAPAARRKDRRAEGSAAAEVAGEVECPQPGRPCAPPGAREWTGNGQMATLLCMARGIGENPAKSPAAVVQQIEFPATRDEIVETAADNEAPAEVINFLKSLPKERYGSQEE